MIVPNVKFNGRPCYVLDQSVVPTCTGDEPGSALGVRSGTVRGETKPTGASTTVKAGKKRIVRERDTCTMNNGNTTGIYVTQPAPGFGKGFIENAREYWEEKKSELSTLWDATGLGSATPEQVNAARNSIKEGVEGVGQFLDTVGKALDPLPSRESRKANAELAQMGKTAWESAANSVKSDYKEGGAGQVAGAATFGLLALGVEALTTKGTGRIAKVLEEAEKLQKLGKKGKKLATGKDGVKIKKQKFYRSKSERRKALLQDADDPNSPLDQEARDYIKKHGGRKVPEGYEVAHEKPLELGKTVEEKRALDKAENMTTMQKPDHRALHKTCGSTYHMVREFKNK